MRCLRIGLLVLAAVFLSVALATGAEPVVPFSFVVFGDNQFATNDPMSGVPERMAVPDDNHSTRTDTPAAKLPGGGSGIDYIVTGGAGGSLNKGHYRRRGPSEAFSQNRTCAYHVTLVQVDGPRLTVNVHLVSGTGEKPTSSLFESFTVGP